MALLAPPAGIGTNTAIIWLKLYSIDIPRMATRRSRNDRTSAFGVWKRSIYITKHGNGGMYGVQVKWKELQTSQSHIQAAATIFGT